MSVFALGAVRYRNPANYSAYPPPDSARTTAQLSPAQYNKPATPEPPPTTTPKLSLPSLISQSTQTSPAATPSPTPDAPKLDPLPDWVRSTQAATLWSRPDGQAKALLSLPENTNLQVLGKAESNRLPVRYESPDANGPKQSGWIDISAITTSGTPSEPSRVAASSRGSRPTPDISTNEKFLLAVSEAAQVSQLDSKVPASVTIAQAILESDWGRSQLAKIGQNYFGIKASSGPGPAGVVNMSTWEVIGGASATIQAGFKAYHNLWESVMDHGQFLAGNKRYAKAFNFIENPKEFAHQIHLAGYATDPAYTSKLSNLIDKFNLTQYDLK